MVSECGDGEWVGAPQRCSNNPEKPVTFIRAPQHQGVTSGGNILSLISKSIAKFLHRNTYLT